jgi:hypothetical protein
MADSVVKQYGSKKKPQKVIFPDRVNAEELDK